MDFKRFIKVLRGKAPGVRWFVPPILASIFLFLFVNDPLWEFWRTITGAPHVAGVQTFTFFIALMGFVTGLLLWVSHPRLVKVTLSFVLFVSAANEYFALNYGTVVDVSMIRNILQTDLREALELFTWPFGWHLFLYCGLPMAWLLTRKIQPIGFSRWLFQTSIYFLVAFSVGVLALGSQYKFFQLIFRQHHELRMHINPTYALYSLAKYLSGEMEPHSTVLQRVALDARPHFHKKRSRPLLVVMVVGETARADHFSLNGYSRLTNPELMKENVLSFGNAWSCGTSTAESVPCMFSDLGRSQYSPDKAAQRQNLLDVLQRINISTLWIDNNSGSKGVSARVPQIGFSELTSQEVADHCGPLECFDEVLIDVLKRSIQTRPNDAFVVLHQMGEHGPSYYKRHPKSYEIFTPECQQDDAFNCPTESLINAYDNDVVYTDHVLAETVRTLKATEKNRNVIMLYMSDHGESLGENGVFLHGQPWIIAPEAQKHVPFIVWVSDGAYEELHIDQACLRASLDAHRDHDYLFHTVLGLFTDRKSDTYRKDLDVFQACRR